MVPTQSVSVELALELERIIRAHIQSGRYQTASDVVREGLRLLDERETDRELRLQAVREKIAAGLAQALAGDLSDGDAFFDELERTSSAHSA